MFRSEMVRAAQQANQSMTAIKTETTAAAQSLSMLNRAAAGFVGFQAVKAGVGSLIEAQVSMQQIHYGLVAATGSAKQAGDAYAYVQKVAQQMGLDLQTSAQGFSQLSAAASANNVSMAQTQELFTAFAKASTVMHLSTEQSNRALLSMEQMFSKGKIQAQELRLQLGQAIPGAAARFQNAVLEMNKGTDLAGKSFDQLLQDGDLVTSKFMPALVKALTDTGRGWEEASGGLNAQLNRLRSNWFQVRSETSNGLFNDAATSSVKFMADNLKELTHVAELTAVAVGTALVGRGVQKGVGIAQGFAESIAASRAEAAATAAATAAKVADAEQAVVASAIRAREMVQRKALAVEMQAQAVTQNEVTAATTRYQTVATQAARANAAYQASITRLTAAQVANAEAQAAASAASATSMAKSGASRAGQFALGLVGGEFGAMAIPFAALGYGIMQLREQSKQAHDEFEKNVKALGDVAEAARDASSAIRSGANLQAGVESYRAMAKTVGDSQKEIDALVVRLQNLKEAQRLATAGDGGRALAIQGQIEGTQKSIEQLQQKLAPSKAELQALGDQLASKVGPAFTEVRRRMDTMTDKEFDAWAKGAGLSLVSVTNNVIDLKNAVAQVQDQLQRKITIGLASLPGQIERIGKSAKDVAGMDVRDWFRGEAAKGVNFSDKNVAAAYIEQGKNYIRLVGQQADAEKRLADQRKSEKTAHSDYLKQQREAESLRKQEVNQLNTLMDAIRQRTAMDAEAIQMTDGMTEADKLAVRVHNDLASAKSKLNAADRARVDVMLNVAVATGRMASEMEKEKKAAEDLARLKNQLAVDLSNQQSENRQSLLGMYSGSDHAEQMRREFEIDKKYADEVKQLRDKGYAETSQSYKDQLAELQASHQQALAEEARYQQQRAQMQADWRNGAIGAMDDYITKAQDVAGMTKNAMSNAFSGMEDMMAQFVTTGKANFADFAKAVIADFVKMETRILLSKAFQWILGHYSSTGYVPGTDTTVDTVSLTQANGGGWNSGVQFFASGGVFDSPTMFRHAGGMGVMGEAGPEAVMPLSRGSDGKLGVRVTGGGGGVNVSISQNFQIEGGQGGGGGADPKAAADFSKAMDQQMRQTALQVISDEQRPGGSLWRMQHA